MAYVRPVCDHALMLSTRYLVEQLFGPD